MRIIVVLLYAMMALSGLIARATIPANDAGGREVVWLDGDWSSQLDPSDTETWHDVSATLPHAQTIHFPPGLE
jgi:hypothetical protein